jgi:hypothetical protein
VLQRHGRGLPTGCVRHANVSLLLQNIGSSASRFPAFFNLFALCSLFGNQCSGVSFDPDFGRAVRPIRSLAVADTLASTCNARRFRSPENLALLSIPAWNYALVILVEVLLIGGELWDFYPQIDTVRHFPVRGRARILA